MRLIDEIFGKGIGVILGFLLGSVGSWLYSRWKTYKEKQNVLQGNALDTIVINQHLVERVNGKFVMRIRSLGQEELKRVIPNGYLSTALLKRAMLVTPKDTLISMDDAEGSYLLETLTNFVCNKGANAPFEHDLYVMAPCCEPTGLVGHQPITIILVSANDLSLFENWETCKDIMVEHSMDGIRLLTLMEMAKRFKAEQKKIQDLHKNGQSARYIETMYVLDLGLDKRAIPIPVKEVPWDRFKDALKEINNKPVFQRNGTLETSLAV